MTKQQQQWSCPIIMSVRGPKDYSLCGHKCAIDSNGPTGERISPRMDHLATHNPSPAEWVSAYQTIQQWNAKGKQRAKEPTA